MMHAMDETLLAPPEVIETAEPEYVKIIDEDNYVYGLCKCALPIGYAIKWNRIKDGKPHTYKARCKRCGTVISVVSTRRCKEMDDFEIVSKDAEVNPCYGIETFHITKEEIDALLSGKKLYSTVNCGEYAITIEMAESEE